jgi:hypothetical protein
VSRGPEGGPSPAPVTAGDNRLAVALGMERDPIELLRVARVDREMEDVLLAEVIGDGLPGEVWLGG